MNAYAEEHVALFRIVAEILARDYIALSETAETVAEWCEKHSNTCFVLSGNFVSLMEPSELAALIADLEGYEKR